MPGTCGAPSIAAGTVEAMAGTTMTTYHFDLVLERPTTDEEDERLFDRFEGHVSPAVTNGVPLLYVHLDAPSMEKAIAEALRKVRDLGFSIRRIELNPDLVPADAA